KAAAATAGSPQNIPLVSKGISFGTIIANPDGTVDATGVQGVDADLVVRPFGWKGREATLRRFVEGGFRGHFGIQTEPSVNGHCALPNPNTFGTGTNCHDPDGDGVVNEITDGQLTAMALYTAMLQAPVRLPPATQAGQLAAQQGEALFAQIG